MTRPLALFAALIAAVVLASCGADEDSPTATADGTFVGTVTNSRAYVALVSDGRQIGGYVCDGRQISRWLKPTPIKDRSAALRGRDGRVLGTVRLEGERAVGEVQLAAQRAQFIAVPARGEAGLYRQITGSPGEPGYRESGWIVLADASARGSTQFTSSDTDLVVGPAPKRTRTAQPVTSFTSNESDF